MPPRIKVLEASSAIGDGRASVNVKDGLIRGTVVSSDNSRRYDVVIVRRGANIFEASSTDNGTRLRGYIGYPIISVMMLSGILPRDMYVEKALSGIPWKSLNEKFRKYSLVEEYLKRELAGRVDWSRIDSFREKVYATLKTMKVYRLESLLSP